MIRRPIIARPRRESLHNDGITDQKNLQPTSATKSAKSGRAEETRLQSARMEIRKQKPGTLPGALLSERGGLRSGSGSLPLPAPAEQTDSAEASGQERESGGQWSWGEYVDAARVRKTRRAGVQRAGAGERDENIAVERIYRDRMRTGGRRQPDCWVMVLLEPLSVTTSKNRVLLVPLLPVT